MPLPPQVADAARAVNNWGRWGHEDELGTLNFITDDVVRAAASCITTGRRISLALPLSEDGPQIGAVPGRINPAHRMTAINSPVDGVCFSDDVVEMGLQAATHWDALSHVSFDGVLYNGFPASSIGASGAARCSIDRVKTIAGRGVLLDVARARGLPRLDAGYAITPDDLDAAEALAGVSVRAGDIALVRTGHMQLFHRGSKREYTAPAPGLSIATAVWLHQHDVAAVATDTLTLEVFPSERKDIMLPVHVLHLVEMGLMQGQNFDLEELAASETYEFFLSATPEPFVRAVGAPVNPVAIF